MYTSNQMVEQMAEGKLTHQKSSTKARVTELTMSDETRSMYVCVCVLQENGALTRQTRNAEMSS